MSKRVQIVHETAMRLRAEGIFHRTTDPVPLDGRLISIDQRSVVNFGSCSYLGLETEPRMIERAYRTMLAYGTQFSTSRAYVSVAPYAQLSRLLSRIAGDLPIVLGTTTTLLHAAALPVLVGAGDTVIYDAQVHNSAQSVLPTLAALGARIESVEHNRLDRVEELAAQCGGRAFYLCDGVYSMFGDTVPVDALFDLLDRCPNLWAYVDDAHGFGWAGQRGAGVVLGTRGMHERLFVVLGLAKACAASGAFIVCPTHEIADRIFSCGSTMIFSGPIVPAALGAAIAAAEILLSDEFLSLQQRLAERVDYFVDRCASLGLDIWPGDTPLKFLRVGDAATAQAICRRLLEDGFLTNVAVYPAVARDGAGVRILFNVHQTLDDIARLTERLAVAMHSQGKRPKIGLVAKKHL